MNLPIFSNLLPKTPIVQLSIPTIDFWADVDILSGIIRSYWAEKRLGALPLSDDGLEAKVMTENGKEFGKFKVSYGKCNCPDCSGEYIVIHHNLPPESGDEIYGSLQNRFSVVSKSLELVNSFE